MTIFCGNLHKIPCFDTFIIRYDVVIKFDLHWSFKAVHNIDKTAGNISTAL